VPTALAGAATIAFSAILVRQAGVSPETAAVFRCAYAVPALGLLALLERRRLGPRRIDHPRAALAGALFAADLILWHHSIANIGAGLATVFGNLQVVLVAFAAWAVLGERPEARVLTAVPVVFMGAVLISGVLEEGAYGDDPAAGTAFGIGTSIAYAGFILVLREMNVDRRRPAGPLLDATAYAALAAALAGAAYGAVDLVPSWPGHAWLVTLALSSQVLGWMLISVSLPRLPAALTSVLLLFQPVSAVVLAAVLLGEAPTAVQLAGVAVILGGVVWATTGRGGAQQLRATSLTRLPRKLARSTRARRS
jgi:drug/metabolite transporter (DMT)-like permease